MKRIVVVIILIAFIGVTYARLTRANRTQKEKAPAKQEQKNEQKKEYKRHCLFS